MATVLALLAATAIAFAVTERAKLVKSPIAGTNVDPLFSPDGTLKPVARVRFRIRTHDRLAVWIEDSHNHNVRTLLSGRTVKPGTTLRLVWDGFSEHGTLEPDGVYRPVVKLERSHRTFVLPNPITLDTKPPVITVKHRQHPIVSPDGDGHGDVFRVPYRIDKHAHAILAVRGTQVVFTHSERETGELVWDGKVGPKSDRRPARPGLYLLTVSAQDLAGNVAKPFPFAIAQVRYIALARSRVVVRPGGRFAIRVSTDAPTVSWRLHGRSGVARRGTLHFRAPRSAGVYFLYVFEGDHAARCAVVVG